VPPDRPKAARTPASPTLASLSMADRASSRMPLTRCIGRTRDGLLPDSATNAIWLMVMVRVTLTLLGWLTF
jgi:hypothetical protein